MLQYCKRIQLERAEKKYFNSAVKIEGIINFTKENKKVHAITISLSFLKLIPYSLDFSTKTFFECFFHQCCSYSSEDPILCKYKGTINMGKPLFHYYSEPSMEEHRGFKGFIVIATKTLELKRRENQRPL